MFRRILLVSLVGPALSLAWMPVSLATVASASLDWSQLQIEVLPITGYPTPGLSFIQRAGSLMTSASTPGDSDDTHTHNTFNWSTTALADSVTPGARAKATVSNQSLAVQATSSAVENPSPFAQNTANALAGRTAALRLDGPGVVVFSLPYDLTISGGPAFDFDDYAAASVSGSASYQPDVGSASVNASRSFSLDSRFGEQTGTLSGPLIFGLVIDGAGTVSVGWQLMANTAGHDLMMPVPEPSTMLQMFAGLFVVGSIVARRALRA